ncbi:hypothetical protein [Ruegeria lacuscaerulensis]|uniref:hypothetical protein n=1 Tax=Ruegeria lacuscaerulensis TaxID=55218 RepID=UPI00147DD11B|nr:hypothetical protein [Ruegeria lacuscaerulensis]
MLGEHQKRLLLEIFENLPGISFLILARALEDQRLAGWVGAILAVCVCGLYARKILRPQPILLGINLFMVVITPLIELLALSGYRGAANVLIGNIDTLVLTSIFLIGVFLTCFSTKGFLTYETQCRKKTHLHSGLLLALCAVGIVWSLIVGQNDLISLVLPLMLLFEAQRFLRAAASDQQSHSHALLAGTVPLDTTAETLA